jgi:hypothetical protein
MAVVFEQFATELAAIMKDAAKLPRERELLSISPWDRQFALIEPGITR